LTYAKDTVLRDIFRDVRFRRAMSLAIDRDEMNEVIALGLAIPSQATVFTGSKYYKEEYARAYADYDPEKANALLDEMGLKWDEKHEYRLRKDGKRLSVFAEFSIWHLLTLFELMKEYWEAVGVETTIEAVAWESLMMRHQSNDVQFGGWNIDFRVGIHEKFSFTDEALIINTQWPLWYLWVNTNGEEGEEPPEEIKRLRELKQKMDISLDQEEKMDMAEEILRSQAENLWVLGNIGYRPKIWVVNNDLRNFPETGTTFAGLMIHHKNPEQFFFKQK